MGIEEVRKEIVDNAKSEANKLLAEARKEEKAIVEAIEKTAKQNKQKQQQAIKTSLEQHRLVVLSEAESAVKKERLILERELLNEVFAKVADKLVNLDAKKRALHMKQLSKKIKEFNFSKVYCSPKDQKTLAPKTEKAEILGGIILENNDGDVRVDISYEVLLDEVKKEEMPAIVETLFA